MRMSLKEVERMGYGRVHQCLKSLECYSLLVTVTYFSKMTSEQEIILQFCYLKTFRSVGDF